MLKTIRASEVMGVRDSKKPDVDLNRPLCENAWHESPRHRGALARFFSKNAARSPVAATV
jgi:hypothetical protein